LVENVEIDGEYQIGARKPFWSQKRKIQKTDDPKKRDQLENLVDSEASSAATLATGFTLTLIENYNFVCHMI